MAAPHYVAKKVGDKYVMVRKIPPTWLDPLCLGGGVLLLLRGLRRRGLFGGLFALAGGALAYRGVTGRSPLCAGTSVTRRRAPRSVPGPSFQHDVRPQQQRPKDEVDEASMQSFPASDPPARMASAKSV